MRATSLGLTVGSGTLHAVDGAKLPTDVLIDRMVFYLASDDHYPTRSAAISCICDADPLGAVQQQIGAIFGRIGALL